MVVFSSDVITDIIVTVEFYQAGRSVILQKRFHYITISLTVRYRSLTSCVVLSYRRSLVFLLQYSSSHKYHIAHYLCWYSLKDHAFGIIHLSELVLCGQYS
jgi:hypothetical protein